jgi:hypothetical protein
MIFVSKDGGFDVKNWCFMSEKMVKKDGIKHPQLLPPRHPATATLYHHSK